MEDSDIFRYSTEDAANFLRTYYNIQADSLTPLVGYDDTNFKVQRGDCKYVLKLTPGGSRYRHIIQMQVDIAVHLKAKAVGYCIANVIRSTRGQLIECDERGWIGRVLEWKEGTVLNELQTITESEWRKVGRALALFTLSVRDFAAAPSDFVSSSIISMDTALQTIQANLKFVTSASKADVVSDLLQKYITHVQPLLPQLPRQVVHNDLHDFNVILHEGDVSGIIDFEDVTESYRLIDLATMASVAFKGEGDVLQAISPLVTAFHETAPLTPAEVNALLGFMAVRMCIFVTFSALQQVERPDEPYLWVDNDVDWERLYAFQQLDYEEFTLALRRLLA